MTLHAMGRARVSPVRYSFARMTTPSLQVRVATSMREFSPAAWDALVPAAALPFASWAFLELLERSGSATPERGWQPMHVSLWEEERLVAAAPAWLKSHSMGELFYNDFRWAEAVARHGGAYYPKLVATVPFSPIPAPKLLVGEGQQAAESRRMLARALFAVAEQMRISSASVLFASSEDLAALVAEGFAPGAGVQFQWERKDDKSVEGFLARFSAKRRHMLKTERAQPAKDGTLIETLTGAELTPDRMAFAARCYANTVDRHAWTAPPLTEAFFQGAPAALGDALELVVASEQGREIACAFNVRGADRLYGRHWGALEERRFLHFNVCYYHAIERCLELGLTAFEPGAGGEHKLVRGFEPVVVRSAHRFVDPDLQRAFVTHLGREVAAIEAEVGRLRSEGAAYRSSRTGEASGRAT